MAALADGITNCTLEIDSAIVFNMIRRQGALRWKHVYLLRRIWDILDPNWHIKLVLKEQNMVADDLAKEVQHSQTRVEFFRLQDLPVKNLETLVSR